MNLSPKEQRIVRKVTRPWWPRVTFWCVILIVVSGVVSIGLAISGWVKLYQMVDAGIQPATINVMSKTWASLLIGSTALMSSIFIWGIRSYGLLIRKLGDNCDD
jgi:ABC-type Fe3+ transport system permease subunit